MNNYIIEYSYAENEYIQPTVRSVKVQTHNDMLHALQIFLKYLRKLYGETTIIEIRAIHFDDNSLYVPKTCETIYVFVDKEDRG
jgi:hypothetical protein